MTVLDAAAWEALVDEAGADVYFRPRYHEWHRLAGQGEPICFAHRDGARAIAVPGMLREIAEAPGRFDLETPNGYGGPIAIGELDGAFLDEAWAALRESMRARGVVAALFRLHPLAALALPPDATVRLERQTVFVTLRAGLDGAVAAADTIHRRKIGKAQKAGATITWDDPADWPRYQRLYGEAMERLEARAELRFAASYFEAMRATPWVSLATLRDGDSLIAGSIFLYGPRLAHFHLGACRDDAPPWASSVVLHAGLERASRRGLEGLHLGGGTTNAPDDPLFRFKQHMGGDLLDFRVARVVVDPTAFVALLDGWRARHGGEPRWLLGYRQPA